MAAHRIRCTAGDFGEQLAQELKTQQCEICIAQGLKEACSCVRSEVDTTSVHLKNLQHLLDNLRRADTAVTKGWMSGDTHIDAANMTDDIKFMKDSIDELATESLKKAIQSLEQVIESQSANMRRRLDEAYTIHKRSCTIM